MIKLNKKQDCSGCHACANVCPKQCISMKSDNEGFCYPQIYKDKCINCNLCEKVCPIINIPNKVDDKITAYACKNIDNKTRNVSSSGGVFSLLCDYVISQKGIVFGAVFDENFNVKHIYVEELKGCERFRGSKYVQSKIGDTYTKAKKFLDNGKIVLFSGTPCQISGLDSFLMKKYENLIMVDVACHGVPSPLVYKKYIESLEEKNRSKVSRLSFRDKSTGWSKYSFIVDFKDGKKIKEIGSDNIYMRGFLSDIYLRPSCYDCRFKKPITSADITLADYWGIQNIHQEFDDDKGVSLVLVNTKKGQDILEKISSNMKVIKTDIEYAMENNPYIVGSVKYNKNRDKFFKLIEKEDLESSIIKSITNTFIQKVKCKIRSSLGKIKRIIIK
ncbi:Coenzyme F420 hydrogenase/dehydrogenase, beta subunit C-terminal domain [Clostridium beijerinckii]|uniref:4Fe-4S ferredoxin-type domain-containing protein n=1 Tax=Clostridium beijerinckii TaxID=1520 RepID=A0A1S9N902_CLOBE|nr:Coenzyme F420 hydrogenase/dehydrogenase, beta subunit C-terminal domain [Clostridium beijerinckii]OOP73823.1 hypothetical protein CBEIBR21_04800 [Clostridium beijerinckii]